MWLPDARKCVRVKDCVGGHYGGAFTNGLCREKPIEGVVVDGREGSHCPRVSIGDRQALEGELVEALGQVLGDPQLA